MSSISSLNTLNSTQSAISSSIKKIATGSKYPSAADSPSDYAIVRKTYIQAASLSQSNTNTQNANAMLNVAAGGVSSTVDALGSLKEKLLNAANSSNSASELKALQSSISQTISQIDSNAGVTYNGQTLLDGSQTLTVAGENGYENITLGNMSSYGLGLTDADGNSTLDLSSDEGIANSLNTVDSALDAALDQSTSIGAAQEGLSYQSANYTTAEEYTLDAASTMGDTDMAAEITNLKSAETQQAFALYATKMNNYNRASVLNLLS